MKIAILLFLANSLNLSFEYKDSAPNQLFPYNYAVTDTSPLGNLSNPAYLPLWNTIYLNIDYAKPYMMGELNSGSIRSGYGFKDFAMQAGLSRFGIKEYGEDILEGNLGYRPWKFFSTGAGISYYHVNIKTEDLTFKYGITDFHFSALFLPFEWINLGYSLENINSLINRKEDREDFIYPNQSAGIALKPVRGITFTWNTNRTYYGYINTFAATSNLLKCLSLKGGYSRETSSYSFAVIFLYDKFSVSYGLSHHTYLGSTHKLGLTVSTGEFGFEEVSYNKSLFRVSLPEKKKKININESSIEELMDSGLFSKEIPERIIKYREIIGPVTEKGLVQIGITENELKDLKKYISGISNEPELKVLSEKHKVVADKHKNKQKKGYDIDTRKSLFQKLLENDVSAEIALKIAELAKTSGKNEIILSINGLSDINDEKKKAIIKICAELL
jgi:hypothetical protein